MAVPATGRTVVGVDLDLRHSNMRHLWFPLIIVTIGIYSLWPPAATYPAAR
jgi:hypothetical protein